MNNMPDFHDHNHAETLLDDYVMGTLSAEDLAWMDEHLATCRTCEDELTVLLEGTYALAWSSVDPPVELSGDLWDRIESSLVPAPASAAAPAASSVPPPAVAGSEQEFTPLDLNGPPDTTQTLDDQPQRIESHPRWNQQLFRLLAIAALAVIVIGVAAIVGRSLWWDQNEPAQQIALHDADGNILGHDVANLEYLPDEQQFVLHMEEMPAAPEGHVYQAWLIAGDVPVGVGIVDPETGEFRVDGDRAAYDAFAITIEPGPEGSELPTTNPIVVAPLDSTG